MKFRWKLLLLMLAVSIPPIVTLRAFGIHSVQAMADALSEEVQTNRLGAARNEIQAVLNSCRDALNMERERLATALFFMSNSFRQTLSSVEGLMTPGARRPARPAGEFPPSQLCVVAPDINAAAHRLEAERVAAVQTTFAAVAEHLGDLVLQQRASLISGAAACFPCRHPGFRSGDVTAEAWYRNAFKESVYSWSRPYPQGPDGNWATSISLLLEDDDDRPIGVVSLEVALSRLMERTMAFVELPKRAKTLLCMLEKKPVSGENGLRILYEYPNGAGPAGEYLEFPEAGRGRDLLEDIARRVSQIVRMPFAGQDAYWAYVPLPIQGAALVAIFPAEGLLQPAQPIQAAIQERLHRVELLTGGFLILLAAVNAAVAFFFSRTVTRPLDELSSAAEHLATGDFETRVRITSRDEFGAMGEAFNRIGPQLKEHYRDREALQAAVEIQQSLLPRAAPRVPGLDIHAMALYSEKIGGDYHDYLCVGEDGQPRLCAAVGDVSATASPRPSPWRPPAPS